MQEPRLIKKTISGLIWSSLELIASQGIKFVIQIFLARLLLPEDFGIIGMITIFIAISQSIVDSGFKNALIREKNSTQEDYSTVFFFNLLLAIFLYLLLFFFSPAISDFFEEPKLLLILRILSLVIIINAVGLIQRTILVKKIDFKLQTKIGVISSVISGAVAIFLAYWGYGVWSLVIQTLSMQFIQSILLSFWNKWKPTFVFSIASFRRLFGFGWKILISGLIDTVYNNIYYFIIGRYFSAIELGYYTNAQKLRDITSQSITSTIQKVSFPVLSLIQDDDRKLKSGYKKIIRTSVFITFPIMMGLIAVSESFIHLLFGVKWDKSIPYFQILCLAGMIFPLHAVNLNILQVKGRSDLFLRLEILKKIIGVACIGLVFLFDMGIIGLLWMAVVTSYISYFLNSYYSGELIAYSSKEQIMDINPFLLISILMGIFVYLSGYIFSGSSVCELFFQIFIGIITYFLSCKLFKIKEFLTFQSLAISALRRK